MKLISVLAFLTLAAVGFAQTAAVPDYLQSFAKTVGKEGSLNADGSYRINLPRTDVTFKNSNGMQIPADLGLATYIALKGTEASSLAVGDVAMLEGEIDRVIDILRKSNFEIVALHNHMTAEEPRLFFMHFQVSGRPAEIARAFHNAISVLGKGVRRRTMPAVGKPKIDATEMETIFGSKRQAFPSGVVRFSTPRKDISVSLLNESFLPGMGLASWAAFHACECGETMVMGDTCCVRTDLQKAIGVLREANIHITAIHNHVLGASQEVSFLHYEGEGNAVVLAKAIKNCWSVLGTK